MIFDKSYILCCMLITLEKENNVNSLYIGLIFRCIINGKMSQLLSKRIEVHGTRI